MSVLEIERTSLANPRVSSPSPRPTTFASRLRAPPRDLSQASRILSAVASFQCPRNGDGSLEALDSSCRCRALGCEGVWATKPTASSGGRRGRRRHRGRRPDRRPSVLGAPRPPVSVANPQSGERAAAGGGHRPLGFLSLLRRSPHLAEVFIREPRPLLLPQAPLDVMVQPRRTHPACLPPLVSELYSTLPLPPLWSLSRLSRSLLPNQAGSGPPLFWA